MAMLAKQNWLVNNLLITLAQIIRNLIIIRMV